ncbi:MAG: ADP-ribosylglycohydrolase family protein [Chloroflexia bacterium]
MLLELAIGDAYGAGFEYVSPYTLALYNDLAGYVQHPTHYITPGCYTDDTQMSIAVAEAIVSGDSWTSLGLANSFVEVYKRDPREGYSASFRAFLGRVRDGSQFLAEIRPTSDKSGAAMRSGPIGVFPSPEEVTRRAALQAAITHNTPSGINASIASALMTHYFIYGGHKLGLAAFLEEHLPGEWSAPWRGKVGSKGWMSVRAAITALAQSSSMSELLTTCIAFSGDVDTVATIALAAGSCSQEIAQDLPPHLISTLENGPYGRDYLIDLDARLMSLANRP